MLQSPFNTLLLKIGDVYVKQYGAVSKTSAMYAQSSDINPADMVNIVGEVVSIPRGISSRPDYKGFSTKDIRIGDTAIFRFDVIYQFARDNKRWKNCFWYRGNEYWAADIQKIFGVIRNNQIIMVNGYCMLEHTNNPVNIILPSNLKNIDGIGHGTLTQIGNNLTHLENIDAEIGDTIYFNPNILQKYEIRKKEFGVVKQSQIFGVQKPHSAILLP